MDDGFDKYYLYKDGSWGPFIDDELWEYSGDVSVQVWHSVNIEAKNIPINGVLKFYLQFSTSYDSAEEAHYKDINIKYIPFINGTDNYKEQIHVNFKPKIVKNGYQQDVHLDDTIKDLLKGTLFTPYGPGHVFNIKNKLCGLEIHIQRAGK